MFTFNNHRRIYFSMLDVFFLNIYLTQIGRILFTRKNWRIPSGMLKNVQSISRHLSFSSFLMSVVPIYYILVEEYYLLTTIEFEWRTFLA